MKDTFFFSHDYNARVDDKIKLLIRKHGMLGYGIFWAIIEDLYNNANALRTDYEGIAFDMRVDENVVESIINNFDLFIIKDGFFGSLSVEERLNKRNEKSIKARESANNRWKNNANAMRTECERIEDSCEGNAIKEIIEKDNKENLELPFKNLEISISEEKNELLSETEQLPLETEKEKKKKSCAKKEKPEITQEIADLLSICTAKFNEKYVNDKTIAMFAKLLKSYSKEQIKQAIENGKNDNWWCDKFISPAKLDTTDKDGVYYIDKFINLKPNGANWSNNKTKQPEHLHNGGKFTTAVTKENF